MPVLHIIAVGPPGSGKSEIVRHLANNPPKGYRLKKEAASVPESYGQEYWVLVFEKAKERKPRAQPRP